MLLKTTFPFKSISKNQVYLQSHLVVSEGLLSV